MNSSRKKIVLLDACVLYPAPVRDLLLYVANELLFQPKWSAIIQDEWVRNLLINRPDLQEERLKNTVKAMNMAFFNGNVTSFESLIPSIKLPDENDRHVVAAAIKANAEIILTFNLKDFPQDTLDNYGILVMHPDDFLCELLEKYEEKMKIAFDKQIKALKKPPISKNDMIIHLAKCGLKELTKKF